MTLHAVLFDVDDTLVDARGAYAAALQQAFGGEVLDEAGLDEWEDLFEGAVRASWRACADALVAVPAVLAGGLGVGAVSNHQVGCQVDKLRGAGLPQVPVLVGIDTLGVGKPDARTFLEACRRLGTGPGETLYVGDELDVGAWGAVRAGLHAAWLDRPGVRRGEAFLEDAEQARRSGVPVLRSLHELPDLVRALS